MPTLPSFARTNCWWPSDWRCVSLPNNDARWLNHLMWLAAVDRRSAVLPRELNPAYWARAAQLSEQDVESYVAAMARVWLVAWTKQGELVVVDVEKMHGKITWKQVTPARSELVNPFAEEASVWRIARAQGDTRGYRPNGGDRRGEEKRGDKPSSAAGNGGMRGGAPSQVGALLAALPGLRGTDGTGAAPDVEGESFEAWVRGLVRVTGDEGWQRPGWRRRCRGLWTRAVYRGRMEELLLRLERNGEAGARGVDLVREPGRFAGAALMEMAREAKGIGGG